MNRAPPTGHVQAAEATESGVPDEKVSEQTRPRLRLARRAAAARRSASSGYAAAAAALISSASRAPRALRPRPSQRNAQQIAQDGAWRRWSTCKQKVSIPCCSSTLSARKQRALACLSKRCAKPWGEMARRRQQRAEQREQQKKSSRAEPVGVGRSCKQG